MLLSPPTLLELDLTRYRKVSGFFYVRAGDAEVTADHPASEPGKQDADPMHLESLHVRGAK